MTATLELDLTQTLCRYAIDPATGALKITPPEDIPSGSCGQAGTPPGNQAGAGAGRLQRAAQPARARRCPATSSARCREPNAATGSHRRARRSRG